MIRNCTSVPPLTHPISSKAPPVVHNFAGCGGERDEAPREARGAGDDGTIRVCPAAAGRTRHAGQAGTSLPHAVRRLCTPPVSASRALLPRLTPLHRRWGAQAARVNSLTALRSLLQSRSLHGCVPVTVAAETASQPRISRLFVCAHRSCLVAPLQPPLGGEAARCVACASSDRGRA